MPRFVLLSVLAALFAVGAVWLVRAPGQAEAHAVLVRADPAVNADLRVPPDIVTAFFSEALDDRLSSIEAVDGTGESVDTGDVTFGPEPERMSVGVESDLAPGFYTVIWESLSSVDGHLFKGSYPFAVLNEDGSQPSGPKFEAGGGGSESSDPEDIAVKWAQLLSATALVGSLAFVLWVSMPVARRMEAPWVESTREAVRKRLRWVAIPAAGALALVAGAELLLQAGQLGGFEFIGDVLRNDWGQRWIQRQIVLVGIWVALFVSFAVAGRERPRLAAAGLWVALVGGFAYLLLIAMVSHGKGVPGAFWAVGADFLHLVGTSVWVGMLLMLALFLLWLRGDIPAAVKATLQAGHLQRFSVFAASSVVILLATGTLNALTQIPNVEALFDTAYGRTLLVKLAVMAFLLAVAGFNAFYLRPRIVYESEEGDPADRDRNLLSRTVLVEIALAFAVILAASVLIQSTTSRQVEQSERAEAVAAQGAQAVVGYDEIQPAGDLQINLTVSPNTVGQNSFRVFLFPQAGGEIGEVLRVRLRFDPPGGDVGASSLGMEPAGPTAWRGVGPFLTSAGNWDLQVDVRRAEIDDVTASFPVPVTGEVTGEQFDFPLAVGSWLTVGAIALLVLSLLVSIWVTGWPGVPEVTPRALRIVSAALSVVGVGLLVISVLPESETAAGNPIDPTAESIAIGRALYMNNCQSCHGQTGRGDGPAAADLPVVPADFRQHLPYHQDEFFFRVITNGLGSIMPAFGEQLTEEERWHLLNFLQSEFGDDSTQPAAAAR